MNYSETLTPMLHTEILERFRNFPKKAFMILKIMCARYIIDGIIAELRLGYLGYLLRDIREYVLMPMLWEGRRFCGMRHRDGYHYDVKHDPTGLLHTGVNERLYYAWGEPHRENGPALISMHGYGFYVNGYNTRSDGPHWIGRSSALSYMAKCGRRYSMNDRPNAIQFKAGRKVFINAVAWPTGTNVTIAYNACHWQILINLTTATMTIRGVSMPFQPAADLLDWFAPILHGRDFNDVHAEELACVHE